METKICRICGKELPTEMFSKHKGYKDGLEYRCKECLSEYMKTYYAKNVELFKQHYEENKETILEQRKEYREENKEKVKKYEKEYREENKEYILKRWRKYYANNKDKILGSVHKVYWQNREHYLEYRRQYRKDNREACYNNKHKYYAKKRGLPRTLTIEQWREIKKHFSNKCAYCGKELPLTQEHFIPLSKGGEYTSNNIIPACQSCNSSKSDKDFFEWYPKYRYYSKKRERKILEYLNYKGDTQQLKLI